MSHPIYRKIEQMHAALGSTRPLGVGDVKLVYETTASGHSFTMDATGGDNETSIANKTSLLLANIGSLRDYLKDWCSANSVPFEGDTLINSDQACAVIHDLWNTDKHVKLTRPPRSGHHVRLINVRWTVVVTAEPGGFTAFWLDPVTGKANVNSTQGGGANRLLMGDVLDENGAKLGEFSEFCRRAVEAWETCLKDAGVVP